MPTTPPNSPSRGKHAWKGSTGRRDNNRRRMEFQNAHGPGPAQLAAIQKDFAGDFAKQAEQRSVDAHTACGGAVAKKTRRRRPRKSVYKPDFQACAKAAELHVREVREVWSCLQAMCAQVGLAIAKANAEAKAAAKAAAKADQAVAKAKRAEAKAKAVAERKVARELKVAARERKAAEQAKKGANKLAAAEATAAAKLATVQHEVDAVDQIVFLSCAPQSAVGQHFDSGYHAGTERGLQMLHWFGNFFQPRLSSDERFPAAFDRLLGPLASEALVAYQEIYLRVHAEATPAESSSAKYSRYVLLHRCWRHDVFGPRLAKLCAERRIAPDHIAGYFLDQGLHGLFLHMMNGGRTEMCWDPPAPMPVEVVDRATTIPMFHRPTPYCPCHRALARLARLARPGRGVWNPNYPARLVGLPEATTRIPPTAPAPRVGGRRSARCKCHWQRCQ